MPELVKRSSKMVTASEPTTREMVVACIRRRCDNVEDIAAALGLTDNAVRFHLKALEQAGVVTTAGVLRTGKAGKPAEIYQLTKSAEELRSRAYAPVLAACLEELSARMPPAQLRKVMRAVGDRLASEVEMPAGSLQTRIKAAAAVLEELGGVVTVAKVDDGTIIRGEACPLASVVSQEPMTCAAMQALLSALIGATVTENCDHSVPPRCCFWVGRADAA